MIEFFPNSVFKTSKLATDVRWEIEQATKGCDTHKLDPLRAYKHYCAVFNSVLGGRAKDRKDHSFWGGLGETCLYDSACAARYELGLFPRSVLGQVTIEKEDAPSMTTIHADLLIEATFVGGKVQSPPVLSSVKTSSRERAAPIWAWEVGLLSNAHRNNPRFAGCDPLLFCVLFREKPDSTREEMVYRCAEIERALTYCLNPSNIRYRIITAMDPTQMSQWLCLYTQKKFPLPSGVTAWPL
jgi:hypothetical protein